MSPPHKRSSLDEDKMKNDRPMSNLLFISKLSEKVIARRMEEHSEHSDLHDNYQSAYGRGHLKALLNVYIDIVEALGEGVHHYIKSA